MLPLDLLQLLDACITTTTIVVLGGPNSKTLGEPTPGVFGDAQITSGEGCLSLPEEPHSVSFCDVSPHIRLGGMMWLVLHAPVGRWCSG
jgi:hypothetical protein